VKLVLLQGCFHGPDCLADQNAAGAAYVGVRILLDGLCGVETAASLRKDVWQGLNRLRKKAGRHPGRLRIIPQRLNKLRKKTCGDLETPKKHSSGAKAQ